MKILFVSPYLPYPIISGGHARVYNLMKQLAVRSHDLYLVANQRYEVTEEQQRELARLCYLECMPCPCSRCRPCLTTVRCWQMP